MDKLSIAQTALILSHTQLPHLFGRCGKSFMAKKTPKELAGTMLTESTESLKRLLITWSTVWICLYKQAYRKKMFWSLKTQHKILNSLSLRWNMQYALKIPMLLFTYNNVLYTAPSKVGLALPCVSLQTLHKSLCISNTIEHVLLLWLLWQASSLSLATI